MRRRDIFISMAALVVVSVIFTFILTACLPNILKPAENDEAKYSMIVEGENVRYIEQKAEGINWQGMIGIYIDDELVQANIVIKDGIIVHIDP